MASNVGAFLALPPQIFLVLFLVFLNSFQGFGIRFVRYQYLTNEYGFSDKAAASLLGVQATLNLFFAGVGAVLTDAVGVRRCAMVAMSVSIVGRALVAFGRSRLELYASFLVLAPVGEALLSVGIYRVSLKKLTTPRTRAFAFAVEYATFNLSGALADVLIDALRRRPDAVIGGATFTGTRLFLVATFFVLLASWVVAFFGLRDETAFVAPGTAPASRVEAALAQLRRCRQAATTLRSRRLWRVFVASLAVFGVAKQWSESEQLMPPFLERRYGEKVPIFTIHSINLWGCLIFPTLVAAKTSDLPAFRVIVPGLWIMALSPLALVASPTPAGAAVWQAWLTAGEVLWSPRFSAWTISLAPEGREGLFIALAGVKDLLLTWPSTMLVGVLNARFNENCPSCRDAVGHFCSTVVDATTCASQTGVCDAPAGGWETSAAGRAVCPATCLECASYSDPNPRTLWTVVLLLSLTSPVVVAFALPFCGTAYRPARRRRTGSARRGAGRGLRPRAASGDGVAMVAPPQDETGLLEAPKADAAGVA
ncbi:hypothetical protein JL722_20 [Aureococcus anophagefferens]|nr:hypothetical protein JL722_20 [Aureococcus anophagefferens]